MNISNCSGFSSNDTGWRAATPPANVQASDGTFTDKVLVTWDAAVGAASYDVYRASSAAGSKTKLGSTSATTFDDMSTAVGTTYYYWVQACSSPGCSDFSVHDTGWRADTPPANIQASDGTYSDKVRVTWDAAGGATSYEVYRASSAAGSKTNLGSTSATTYDDAMIVVGTTYYYWVTACYTPGCGGYSSHDSGYAGLPAPILISPPESSVVKDMTPTFEWTAPPGAIKFELQVDDNSDFSSPLVEESLTSTSYTPSSVLADGDYYWRVRSNDGSAIWSNYTAAWDVTVDPFKVYLPITMRPQS